MKKIEKIIIGLCTLTFIFISFTVGYIYGYEDGSNNMAETFFSIAGNLKIENMNFAINETEMVNVMFDKMGLNQSMFNMSNLSEGEKK